MAAAPKAQDFRQGEYSQLPLMKRESSEASSIEGKSSEPRRVGSERFSNNLAVQKGRGAAQQPESNVANKNEDIAESQKRPQFEEENMTVQDSPSDGMHIFGIGKAGISRCVVIFSRRPNPEPNAICFHFPNTFLSHAYVLHCLRDCLKDVPDVGFTSLSFIDRNVMHGCTGLENRWVVRCKNLATKHNLIDRGLSLCNKHVICRSLDDVLDEEYSEYVRYKSHRTKLYGHNDVGLPRPRRLGVSQQDGTGASGAAGGVGMGNTESGATH